MLDPAVEALHLFNDEKAKKEAPNVHEYNKKKFAVAEYPPSDLKDLLPGEIPLTDFSGNKPSNQIAFTSFQTYVDPFFRNYNDEDLRFLKTKSILSNLLPKDYDEKKTREIPPLGPYYQDVWHDEDVKNGLKDPAHSHAHTKAMKQMKLMMKGIVEPKGSSDSLNNELLETENVSCGPLTSRLLSALINEDEEMELDNAGSAANGNGTQQNHSNGNNIGHHQTNGKKANGNSTTNSVVSTPMNHLEDGTLANGKLDSPQPQQTPDGVALTPASSTTVDDNGSSSALPDQQNWKANPVKADYKTLDERLQRELKYIGVYMNVQQTLNNPNFEQDWCENKEDDEVSAELRFLQKQLKSVQARNNKRKKTLIPIVDEHIAWQEYMSILEDLDKQVEQYYRRQFVGEEK
ncbi:unnamed protein product [Ambrosiozyma monospora]|uniref:Unnamed protein product n=1 Tax=Ambrosiozyma monospora TaxID=43982 RepID=A0ACB5U553_AMBMO|nr:unnamed protein product [Ambrosiozyma monospora]